MKRQTQRRIHLGRAAGFSLAFIGLIALAACQSGEKKTASQTEETTVADASAAPPPPPLPPSRLTKSRGYSGLVGGRRSAGPSLMAMRRPAAPYWQPSNTSRFPDAKPNVVKVTADDPVSTFSIDVDTDVLRRRARRAQPRRAAAAQRGARGGDGQLFPLRLSGAGEPQAAVPRDAGGLSDAVERRYRDPAYRHQGLRPAQDQAPAGQPRLPDRHLGLDE